MKTHALIRLIDSTSFTQLFALWMVMIVTFGFGYHLISILFSGSNYLDGRHGEQITGFTDKIYFSFVSATTTGYGDITPAGPGLRSLAM